MRRIDARARHVDRDVDARSAQRSFRGDQLSVEARRVLAGHGFADITHRLARQAVHVRQFRFRGGVRSGPQAAGQICFDGDERQCASEEVVQLTCESLALAGDRKLRQLIWLAISVGAGPTGDARGGIQVVDRMLTQSPASVSGKHYTVEEAHNDPMPVQKPRPPIMIGGSGEKETLRIAAQYADFCNVGGDPATVAHGYDVLRQHCERVGRLPEAVTRSNDMSILIAANERELAAKSARFGDRFTLMEAPDMVVDGLRKYAQAGSQYVTFNMPDTADIEPIQLLRETVVAEVARV